MSTDFSISNKDRKILEVVARGHPDRRMTSIRRGVPADVSALTLNDIRFAVDASQSEVTDSIARLVANNYVEFGRQKPSVWGKLKGEKDIAFFWVTPTGRAFLRSSSVLDSEASDQSKINRSGELNKVISSLGQLGYRISAYGVGVAILSLESGHSPCETASHMALVTLARDARDAGLDIAQLAILVPRATSMISVLIEFKNAGLIRESLFKNDARAILGVVMVDEHQEDWISLVLSDPILAGRRVATFCIDSVGV
jgi:hypothetical protein